MPRLTPVSRPDFVRRFRSMGFGEPFRPSPNSDHDYMERDGVLVKVPNPHGEIDVGLLRRIMRDAGISRDEWFRSA
jgi:predicted RNA binding protein YcfA (HicA-like mRNA interferase family)